MFSGLGPETMDGGIGIDLIDHTAFNGTYIFNMATGLTNFGGESYINFENATMGGGHDTVTGNASGNVISGGAGNDTLSGAGGNDVLNGGVGADLLTGGSGTNTFRYQSLQDSLLASYDVITDYALGDIIDAPASVLATTLAGSSGAVASLSASAISTVLTSGVFTANSARAFTVNGVSGTFVALNNAVDGFDAANDAVIFLQNYTGAIAVS